MGGQKQLRGNLGFGFALVFEGGEVPLVLIGRHFFPVEVIRCGERKRKTTVIQSNYKRLLWGLLIASY